MLVSSDVVRSGQLIRSGVTRCLQCGVQIAAWLSVIAGAELAAEEVRARTLFQAMTQSTSTIEVDPDLSDAACSSAALATPDRSTLQLDLKLDDQGKVIQAIASDPAATGANVEAVMTSAKACRYRATPDGKGINPGWYSVVFSTEAPASAAATPSEAPPTWGSGAFDKASCPVPRYPARAKTAGIQGTTKLSVLIDATGNVIDSRIDASSGNNDLDQASLRAFSRCRFKPQEVPKWVPITYQWAIGGQ